MGDTNSVSVKYMSTTEVLDKVKEIENWFVDKPVPFNYHKPIRIGFENIRKALVEMSYNEKEE